MFRHGLNLIRYGLFGLRGAPSPTHSPSVTVFAFFVGGLYSLYFIALSLGGHSPSSTRFLFVPAEDFYWVASLYTTLAIPGLAFAACFASWSVMRSQHAYPFETYWNQLAPNYVAPLLVLYLLPECIIYGIWSRCSGIAVRALGGAFALTVAVRFYLTLRYLHPGHPFRIICMTLPLQSLRLSRSHIPIR